MPATRHKLPAANLEGAAQLDFDDVVQPNHFPRVRAAEPVVWFFVLPAVLNVLLEDAVLVAQSVPHRRQVQGCHGLDEAGRQAAQAAITETRIGLLIQEFVPVDVLLAARFEHRRVEQQIRYVARERPADQELHRKVVGALGIQLVVRLLRAQPPQRKHVAKGTRDGLIPLAGRRQVGVDRVVKD